VERPVQETEERKLLYMALDRLNERERSIITMRFGLDGRDACTQKEVADSMGISQSYISRLEKRIIARLKSEFGKIALG
jgi:RNA polymerase sporulation-specific sigma factor